MDLSKTGAHIEILDSTASPKVFVPGGQVRINGTDVGMIAAGGVQISQPTTDEVLTVTITFMPRRLEFKGLPGQDDPQAEFTPFW